MEYLTYDLCDRHSIEKSNRKLYDLLDDLYKEKIIPDSHIIDFNYIRKIGNDSAHANDIQVFSIKQAMNVLSMLCSILEWYIDNFKPRTEEELKVDEKYKDLDEDELVELGNQQNKNAHYDDAIRTFDFVIKRNSYAYEARVEKAYALIKMNRFKDALQEVKIIPRDDIEYSGALRISAHIASNKGLNEKALKLIRHALRINPDCSRSLNLLGYVCHDLKRVEEAKKYYSEAYNLNPNYLIPLRNRAILNKTYKLFDESISDYSEVIRLEPENKNNFYDRALVYDLKQEYEKSLEDYLTLLKSDPENSKYHANVSNAHLNIQYHIYRDVSLAPEIKEIDRKIATVQDQKNQCIANQQYETAAELRDDELQYLRKRNQLVSKLKDIYIEKKKYHLAKAEINIKNALQLVEDDDFIWYTAAIVYHNKGDVVKAKMYYNKTIELNDSNPNYYFSFGELLYYYEDYEKAIFCFQNALNYGYSSKCECNHNLARTYFANNNYVEAGKIVEQTILEFPKYGNIYILKARLLEIYENYEAALNCFNKAQEFDVVLSDFYIMRKAIILGKLKKFEASNSLLNNLISKGYSLATSYMNRSNNNYSLNNSDDVIDDINKFYEYSAKKTSDVHFYLYYSDALNRHANTLLFIQNLEGNSLADLKIRQYYYNALVGLNRSAEIHGDILNRLQEAESDEEIKMSYRNLIVACLEISTQVDELSGTLSNEKYEHEISMLEDAVSIKLEHQNYEEIGKLKQRIALVKCAMDGSKEYWLHLLIEYYKIMEKDDIVDNSSTFLVGQAFYRLKKYKKAFESFEACYNAKHSENSSLFNMILCCEYREKINKAKKYCQILVNSFPDYKDGHTLKERIDKL